MTIRSESDANGPIDIPADRYWGAQTARALRLFPQEGPRLPVSFLRAFSLQKAAAARANMALGVLDRERGERILAAAVELRDGRFDDHFPLSIWQTGSGTQTNMNANEVLANRANELSGQPLGTRDPIHPNDHVNLGQSSNDTFPTVMHVAAVLELQDGVLPALDQLETAFARLETDHGAYVRMGRTHLNDAVPVTLGQTFASYRRQVSQAQKRIAATLADLKVLSQGGTAAGSGLNAAEGFDQAFCAALSDATGIDFAPNPVKVEGMAAHDALVAASAALEGLATALIHILNDIRLLAAGPRAGLAELKLPDDGLSSSIMPGKRNATLAEALLQVCFRAIGNHTTVVWAAGSGLFELNVAKPVLIHAFLESATGLKVAIPSFVAGTLNGLEVNGERMAHYVNSSLMLATALTPRLGYDRVAEIIRLADLENLTLREACARFGVISMQDYDALIDPARMANGGRMKEGERE